MVKVAVIYGLGIGCHKEVAHAFERAGAEAELVHMNQLLYGSIDLSDLQIINFSGGFLQGDILGAGMCAANQLEHATVITADGEKRVKEQLIEFAEAGNVIYGQCNGFQLLVKTGLLPGLDNNYSRQTVTLTNNNCGVYRVGPVFHKVEITHFAFHGVEKPDLFNILWCRHGEGKIQFYSKYGLVSEEEGEENRRRINENHVLLRYANPRTWQATEEFPYNPNGSVDGIAGLVNNPSGGPIEEGTIFAHMAHPEASVYVSRNPEWSAIKDKLRRKGYKAEDLGEKDLEAAGLQIFKNIVDYFK